MAGGTDLGAVAVIEFHEAGYSAGGREILHGVSFEVERGETLVLLGRSGSGKTTILKLINGLLWPSRGLVRVDGKATADWDPVRLKRRIGYAIQEIGLFPHRTVAQNIGLVPRLEAWPAARIDARIDELLTMFDLDPLRFRDRYPRELSGGQRQRTGIARALAADPEILLFDEPFGALDPVTRVEAQRQFLSIAARLHKTSVFVTHDVREALRLGSRIALIVDGAIDWMGEAQAFRGASTREAQAFLRVLD